MLKYMHLYLLSKLSNDRALIDALNDLKLNSNTIKYDCSY
jgi:hypothetical protein